MLQRWFQVIFSASLLTGRKEALENIRDVEIGKSLQISLKILKSVMLLFFQTLFKKINL